MATAVKVGNVVRIDTTGGKRVRECHSRVYVVMEMLWVCH